MEYGGYDEFEDLAFGYADEQDEAGLIEFADEPVDSFEDLLHDVDFSEASGGDFRKRLRSVNRKLTTKVIAPDRNVVVEGKGRSFERRLPNSGQRVIAPVDRDVIIEGRKRRLDPTRPLPAPEPRFQAANKRGVRTTNVPVGKSTTLKGNRPQKIGKVIVPDDRKVIVQGVSEFILSQGKGIDSIKNIGYYQGKKLQELVFTFNNDTPNPFVMELFNPSMPLDYLYNTSLNINDKIDVAGGEVSYTDVLFNVLANSTMIPNAQFVFSGASVNQQRALPIIVKNKSINGKQKVHPFNLELKIDNMQVANDIVYFDFFESINRAFIPDGMDVIEYTILPNMTVTMCFYYDQISLKKVFRKEARNDKGLL